MKINIPGSTVAIVGAGSSGIAVATQIIEEIRSRKMFFPDLMLGQPTLRLYEVSDKIGPGMPYHTPGDTNGAIFMLNQPAYAMSPFERDPGHFTRWLEKAAPGSDEYTFASRHTYGQYLGETFSNAQRLAKDYGIKVEVVQAHITNIGRNENGFSLVDTGHNYSSADQVVIATGHAKGEFLSEYDGHPNYFDCPFDIERSRQILEEDSKGVLLIGTSQTMLDALAVLHDIQYRGPIYAASRKQVMPWSFNPHTHKTYAGGRYEYQILTPERLASDVTWRFEKIKALFMKELALAQDLNVPMGFVLGAYNGKALRAASADHITLGALREMEEYVNALYGNPTPPGRYDLLNTYLEHGNLSVLQMDLRKADISIRDGGFCFETAASDGKRQSLHVRAVYNCASMQMKSIDEDGNILFPLHRKLDRQGALIRHAEDRHAFMAGAQAWDGLYLVGPSTNSRRWGIETFRKATDDVTRKIVRNMANYVPVEYTEQQRVLNYA